MENPWFDRIILSLIGLNCVTMLVCAAPFADATQPTTAPGGG